MANNKNNTSKKSNASKEIEFRNFELDDLDLILKIIDDIGIEEFKDCFKNLKIEKDEKTGKLDVDVKQIGIDVGFAIISKIIKNSKKCLNSLYELVANLSGLDIEEAKKISLTKFASELIKLFKSEENKDFLTLVSSLKK